MSLIVRIEEVTFAVNTEKGSSKQALGLALHGLIDGARQDGWNFLIATSGHAYVQFSKDPGDQSILVEAVSNTYLPEDKQLTWGGIYSLHSFGFEDPDTEVTPEQARTTFTAGEIARGSIRKSPNYFRYFDCATPLNIEVLAAIAVEVLSAVYGAAPDGELKLELSLGVGTSDIAKPKPGMTLTSFVNGSGGLVFTSLRLFQELEAVRLARTWGEFRSVTSPETQAALETGNPSHNDNDVFRLEECEAYNNGSWPGLEQQMLSWVPEDIRLAFGRLEFRALGEASVSPEKAAAITDALRRRGYRFVPQSSEVSRAGLA